MRSLKAVPHVRRLSSIFFPTALTTAFTVAPPYLLYNATKGAIEQMTCVLCKDLGKKGIFVNAVAPGPTGSELFYRGQERAGDQDGAGYSPQRKIGTPDEVARTFMVLSSAPWVSGGVVWVSGGMAQARRLR